MKFLGKFIERSMWFFPLAHIILILNQFINMVQDTNIISVSLLIFYLYFLPPLLYRIFSMIIPIKKGNSKLGPDQEPSGWMIAHRLQIIYYIFPFIEGVLNSLPGIYSNWLRLWGSNIGRMVYWAPDVKIYDRTHLNIGDNTFIGGSLLSCHLVIPKKDGTVDLLFKPINIGSQVFISTQCNIGPGAKIADQDHIKIMTQVFGSIKRELIKT